MVIFFFCRLRSIHLAYVEDVEVKGIQAYRFAPPSDVLMNPKENPTNEGFCVPAGDCLGTGVLKVSVCREGKSLPSFPPNPVPVPSPLQIIPDSKQTCWALYLHSHCLSIQAFAQYTGQWLTVYGGHWVGSDCSDTTISILTQENRGLLEDMLPLWLKLLFLQLLLLGNTCFYVQSDFSVVTFGIV